MLDWQSVYSASDGSVTDPDMPDLVPVPVLDEAKTVQRRSEILPTTPRETVHVLVQQDGRRLSAASYAFQSDPEIVLAALPTTSGDALEFASDTLLEDRGFMLRAVTQGQNALFYASEELRGDYDLVLAAVQHFGCALEFASYDLQANKELVLFAVGQDGMALRHASEDLQADHETVVTAVQQCGVAIAFAADELRKDPSIMKACKL